MSEDLRNRDAESRRDRQENGDPPQPASAAPDPNDEIPVPIAMWPSEIDERAQVVESLREDRGIEATDASADDRTIERVDERAEERTEEPRDGAR